MATSLRVRDKIQKAIGIWDNGNPSYSKVWGVSFEVTRSNTGKRRRIIQINWGTKIIQLGNVQHLR